MLLSLDAPQGTRTLQYCESIPVRSVPGDMSVGFPGGCGCCSPGWGMSPVETCGLAACLVGLVLTGALSGTMTGAGDLTEHSERRRSIRMLRLIIPAPVFKSVKETET